MLKPENIAIIGGGAIGTAFSEELIIKYPNSKINIFSRKSVSKIKTNMHTGFGKFFGKLPKIMKNRRPRQSAILERFGVDF